MDTLLGYLIEIIVDNCLGNVVYHSVGNSLLIIGELCAAEHRNLVDVLENYFSCTECELAAVCAVNLVAVVLSGVV